MLPSFLSAFHGGIWRGGFRFGTVGIVSALAYYVRVYSPAILGGVSLTAVAAAYVAKNGLPIDLP